jgi:ADP-ribose pyrophosphatase YjhB (NUDIX family)
MMKKIAGVVVFQEGKYLLVQEKKASVYGLWNIPAGHVDSGETVEEAALREGKEETGYTLKLGSLIKTFNFPEVNTSIAVFSASILDGEISFNKEELLDVRWVLKEDIVTLKLRDPFLRELLT